MSEHRATLSRTAEVLVVGAGPAGLAAAIRARQAGLAVTVLEQAAAPPLDKACGEGLMPDACQRLRQLGVELPAGAPLRGIRYLDGDLVAEGAFPGASGLGLRRTRLHTALLARAEELGVELCWGVRVTGPGPRGVAAGEVVTSAGGWQARWLLAADGLHSPLRRWAGLQRPPRQRLEARRFGIRRHYRIAPWNDLVEVYWGSGCEAYVTPVAAGEVGVALLWSGRKASFERLLADFPSLAGRLQGAATCSRDRGWGPLRQDVAGVHQGRLALLGDAAGYLDAITGEGLALAFHQVFALVEAITAGDLRRYARAHRQIARLPTAITGLMLWLERRPRLRRRLLRTLADEPALFARLLGIHARLLPPARLGLDGVARLARALLA